MKRIRICFVIDTIEYQLGGTEKQLILLLRHLDHSRFKPYLCCLKGSDWLRDHGSLCRTYVIGFNSFYLLRDYLKLLRFSKFVRNQKIDIIQTHFRDANIVGILAGKLARVKTIISTRRNQGYWHSKREIGILKALNPLVSSFMANCNAVKDYVHRVEEVPEGKIKVIYNGIEMVNMGRGGGYQRWETRKKLNLDLKSPIIVLTGNLRPVKSIDVFLRAARLVVKEYPSAKFVVIGDGPERMRLMDITGKLELEGSVIFLGRREDVTSIVAACDIGVSSSCSEGLSNAIIEYMAGELPVVCTDVGGSRELVENGKNGFVVPSGDHYKMALAIKRILVSPSMAECMGEESRKRAEGMLSLDMFIRRIEAYYSEFPFGE